MAVKDNKETPLMKQYYAMKAKYPDALMLFRMGDFYLHIAPPNKLILLYHKRFVVSTQICFI